MVGRFASGCLLGAWFRFAEGRCAAGGAGVSKRNVMRGARSSEVLVAAARRFLVLLGGISAVVVTVGLLFAALGAVSSDRAVSLGFYGVGAFLVLGGFLVGNRGPYRPNSVTGDRVGRSLRRATPDDTRDSVNMAALLVVLGFLLLAIGIIIDSRFELV